MKKGPARGLSSWFQPLERSHKRSETRSTSEVTRGVLGCTVSVTERSATKYQSVLDAFALHFVDIVERIIINIFRIILKVVIVVTFVFLAGFLDSVLFFGR